MMTFSLFAGDFTLENSNQRATQMRQCHDGYFVAVPDVGSGERIKIVLFITSTRKLFNKNFHLISLVIKFSVAVKLFSLSVD